ncbi:MAG: flavodoxin family protein [Candidatus Lokiarchaeota archaeon]|nr:flavodoxin family protein [Candidatus Lokiarchaeota archaeon]
MSKQTKGMKALVLNGFSDNKGDSENMKSLIIEELERNQYEVEHLALKDVSIAPCQGCFDCWLTTPGQCRIADNGREIIEKMGLTNLIVHFTPIVFGGYSYQLKKVLDRFIPLLLPFLTRRKGETHHKFRFEKRPSIITIGILNESNDEKESIFKELVYRNSLNMGGPVHEAIIYTITQNQNELVNYFAQILKKVEEHL